MLACQGKRRMAKHNIIMMACMAVPVFSQAFQAENLSVVGQFGAWLAKLENAARCKAALAPKSEFETTSEFDRRREQYIRNSIQSLREAGAIYNSRDSKEVVISFALRQGSYNADAGIYSFLTRRIVLLDYGFSMAENTPYVRLNVETPWNKFYFLSVGGLDFNADSSAARRFRSRESQMRAVLYCRLKAVAFEPRVDANYSTPLGLAFLPSKLEVRDPTESSSVFWSRDLAEGAVDIWNLHAWQIVEPELCTKPCSADGAADPRSVIPA